MRTMNTEIIDYWKNGEFNPNSQGKYIRLTYNENFELYLISHIAKDLIYMVKRS